MLSSFPVSTKLLAASPFLEASGGCFTGGLTCKTPSGKFCFEGSSDPPFSTFESFSLLTPAALSSDVPSFATTSPLATVPLATVSLATASLATVPLAFAPLASALLASVSFTPSPETPLSVADLGLASSTFPSTVSSIFPSAFCPSTFCPSAGAIGLFS